MIVSTDEMTGIQALEHKYPAKPTVPHMITRTEFEYIRHGTTTLIGFFDVVAGKIVHPYLNKTRTADDFVRALARLINSDPRKPSEYGLEEQLLQIRRLPVPAMSYRPTNGFDNYDGANYDLALWAAYYNFLRPHRVHRFQPPVRDEMIMNGENMLGKWQLMIYMSQQVILYLLKGAWPFNMAAC